MTAQRVIAFFGRQGHGKTTLMNKLTGSRFVVSGGARSCTTTLQFKETSQGILCVDTPGFYTSSDVAKHVASQKVALEGVPLSGVYVVVKHARADDISEMLSKVMDCLGEDVRIIVTFEDVAKEGAGYNKEELKRMLSDSLGVRKDYIITVGKDTPASIIEDFIINTMYAPRQHEVNDAQISSLAALCVGPRSVEKRIQVVYAKIQAASIACQNLVLQMKSRKTDSLIVLVQHDTTEMVKDSKEELFRWAYDDLNQDQQQIVYGKVGLNLSIRLKDFIDTTNGFLSYTVASSSSMYRKCPYCHLVFVKTEGCDGQTICGNIPSIYEPRVSNRNLFTTSFIPSGSGWTLQFMVSGKRIDVASLPTYISQVQWFSENSARNSEKMGRGCGKAITWSQMAPLSASDLMSLGMTDLLRCESLEANSRSEFESSVQAHEKTQRTALADALMHN